MNEAKKKMEEIGTIIGDKILVLMKEYSSIYSNNTRPNNLWKKNKSTISFIVNEFSCLKIWNFLKSINSFR